MSDLNVSDSNTFKTRRFEQRFRNQSSRIPDDLVECKTLICTVLVFSMESDIVSDTAIINQCKHNQDAND